MVCNHGVGSSNLPRSTIEFKEVKVNSALPKKYQFVPFNELQQSLHYL
jgi:hypothetical protein